MLLTPQEGDVGQVPVGWKLTTPGFQAVVTDEDPKQGKRCVRVAIKEGASPSGQEYGVLLQACNAAPYRGKVVRLRGCLRVNAATAADRAQLWMRVDRPNKQRGFFDNVNDRPVRDAAWASYDIVGDVAADAESIYFGLIVIGGSPV